MPVDNEKRTKTVIQNLKEKDSLRDLRTDDGILRIHYENVDVFKWLRIGARTWLL
jgi:hypothetical protein